MKSILLFFLLLTLILLAFGCSNRRLLRKLATDTVTVRQMVTVTVPKDSAVLRLVTDTTTVVREVRQGRATVRIVREPTYTTVYANCDSVQITKEAIAKVPRNNIMVGVNKWYKRGFYFLLIVLGVLCMGIWLSRYFTVNIARK